MVGKDIFLTNFLRKRVMKYLIYCCFINRSVHSYMPGKYAMAMAGREKNGKTLYIADKYKYDPDRLATHLVKCFESSLELF